MNRERVGVELGIDYRPDARYDYFFEGNCDDGFLELIQKLGWVDELMESYDQLPPESQGRLDSIGASR